MNGMEEAESVEVTLGDAAAAALVHVTGSLPPASGNTRDDIERMFLDLAKASESGDMRRADTLPKPWDILPDEGWAEYRMFQQWLSLPKRSKREVAVANGIPESAVTTISRRYAWTRRGQAHDWWWSQAADTMRKAALAEAVQQAVTQVAQMPSVIADGLLVAKSKLGATIQEIADAEAAGEPHPVTLAQLARLLDAVRGLSSELRNWTQAQPSFSLNVNTTVNTTAMSLLSTDELADFVRVLADANLIEAEALEVGGES